MKKIRILYYLLIGLLVYWLIPPLPVAAAGEFQADYNVQYAVAPSGRTIVTQQIKLSNKLSNYYPKSYTLLLDSDKISNVIAYDEGGVITPNISVKDGKTEITVSFNTQVVGLGRSLSFSLRYEHAGVASKTGTIWEIYLPGVVDDPDIGRYDVSLTVPDSFGPNAYMTPLPKSGRIWTKEQMVKGGVAAAYGVSQNFILELSYFLTNTSLRPTVSQIALPPDTAYQKVVLESVNPRPIKVSRDADGNWLADFRLGPGQNMEVVAKVAASVFLNPRPDFLQPPIDSATYLRPDDYWESDYPTIKQLAASLGTPRAIYNFVKQKLSYDYTRVSQAPKRLGALSALNSPKNAVCMEFTDLFIALSRAAGIPAREVVGYAHTTNPRLRPLSLVADVLHAWPEYYDKSRNLWIPVDPTWENTTGGINYFDKLDFNHVVFAIHGLDSSTPYPAGFYRKAGKEGKDVIVRFAEAESMVPTPKIKTAVSFPQVVRSGTVYQGEVKVENLGSVAGSSIAVSLDSDAGEISPGNTIDELLPYAASSVPFTLYLDKSTQFSQGTITVSANGEVSYFNFRVQPAYLRFIPPLALALLAILIYGLILRRRVWINFRKKSPQ